jgi:hypothetical protein
VDCWLNWLKCNFDGLNIDENDGFMHLMFGKEEEYQQEHFKSLLLPIKYQWKQRGMFGKGGVLKVNDLEVILDSFRSLYFKFGARD